jgi:hypothetical protein
MLGNNQADRPYYIGTEAILQVSEVTDLGIVMDPRLKFSNHIQKLAIKGHQRANLILLCFVSRDPTILVKAFITYVRPVLEYCSSVWSPFLIMDINCVEAVQRRFTERIAGLHGLDYCSLAG